MKQRLQKAIAQSGITSRRKAEELIRAGKVSVNSTIITEMGYQVSEDDIIMINNRIIEQEKKVYYVINKPREVLSSVSDDRGRAVVTDLIKCDERIFPVGRLDYHTTGLLILTNDGEFANMLIHPRYQLAKKYHVKVKGQLTPMKIERLEKGLVTKEDSYLPAIVSKVNFDSVKKVTHLDLTIFEGKNRQIRKMMEFLRNDVLALKRLSIGSLKLGNLRTGQYRKLSHFETKQLRLDALKGYKQ